MDPLKPGDPGVVGRYRLSARWGQGGLGTVFLGRAPGGDHVTVKLVRPDLASDKTFLERFRKDVTTAREVGGTHVAHVLDADPDGTPPWLVVEHVAGPSLESAVGAHGPLPEHSLRALGAGLAEGLAAIHEVDLTHRDLKPANVLLAADGPRVADYSLARALGSAGMTRTGVVDVPGLPAPEQVTGGSIGPAIDVFALGGVLCHAAGVAPFGAGSAAEIAQRVVREMPDLTELPDWLGEIVADCLKKRPTARPSAADLVARFAAAEPSADWLPEELRALVAAATAAVGDAPPPKDAESADGEEEEEEPETTEVPAAAALATATPTDTDETPVATPAVRAGKKAAGKPATGAAAAAKKVAKNGAKPAAQPAEDEAETDATPVATPAVRPGKKGAAKPAAEPDATATTDADDATPVATPAVRPGKKGAAKTTRAPAAGSDADEAGDETPVATPASAAPGKIAKPTARAAETEAEDEAEDDATPVATPAVRAGKKGAGKPAAGGGAAKNGAGRDQSDADADADADEVNDDEDDATPVASPAVRADQNGAGKPAAEKPDPDSDATTPVVAPAVRVGKDDDVTTPIATPAAPAPEADKPAAKAPYDGGAPVKVPAIRRGTDAETVKVARDSESPAPADAGAETVKVARDSESAAPPRPDAPTRVVPAPPFPTDAPAAATEVPPFPTGSPFPLTPAPARAARPANPVIWHAVIALLGVTAVGIGLFRITDSAWRDAQNAVMGVVLPGISVLAGLAGLATLALAVLDSRRKAAPGPAYPPGTAPVAEPRPTEADSAR
ncbi:protein kinase [Embleya sp. NPDC050154]|uniref:serine/threonine-protein kinase n=1 Tax=Embleya sp. NPDC050154 TaxID=3363988 RepID=UPI00379A7561